MRRLLSAAVLAVSLVGSPRTAAFAQSQPDSVTAVVAPKPTERLRVAAVAVPLGLVGAGVLTMGDRTPISSVRTRAELQRHYGDFHTPADDYIQYAPYAGLAVFAFSSPHPRQASLDNALLLAKAGSVLGVTVFTLKSVTRVRRPDGSARNAFPSGHTANAFLAATLFDLQLRARSRWYGVGAYAVASSVGVLRMLNDRHWQSDVLAGAGIGILTARLAHWQHYRARRKTTTARRPPTGTWRFAPVLGAGGTPGLALRWVARR